MTYQDVRSKFEALTKTALMGSGTDLHKIEEANIFFDNFGETPPGPDVSYATISLSFTDTAQDVVGCGGMETLQGSLAVNIYTPKQTASVPGETICLRVMKEWLKLGSYAETLGLAQACVRNINGPNALAPDARPHHVNNISGRWTARVA